MELWAWSKQPLSFFISKNKEVFQEAWLALLRLHVPPDNYKSIVQYIPEHVLPHLSRPLCLADFYLHSFQNSSTELSILSLSGLFYLLTQCGLGDPQSLSSSCGEYYERLYILFQPDTFRLAKRAQFQRLAAASLSSSFLPAKLAAAFAKKCMFCAVSCIDHGAVMWLLAVAYVLIQNHQSHCKFLLHNPSPKSEGEGGSEKYFDDPFETDAPLSVAVDQVGKTSLWELQLLRRHHIPTIALVARHFLKPFFTPSATRLDPESFLDHGGTQMYKRALRAGDRQMAKWILSGQNCPVAFHIEDETIPNSIVAWSAFLATEQRQLGSDI